MAITLNYTTISDCESTSGWSTVGSAGNLADSDYPSKEGSQCIEFDCGSGATDSGIKSPSVTGFDIRNNEVSLWFLNPKVNDSGDELISASDSALKLRLYSSDGNWADFYQKHHRGSDGNYNGGWLYLRASGGPGSEDANSGTWGPTQVSSVVAVAVLLSTQGDNTGKNAAEYGVDWAKYYDKIIITGYKTGTTPYTLHDVYVEDSDKASGGGVWGVVSEFENFYSITCGLECGDGSNAGGLKLTNEYLFFNRASSDYVGPSGYLLNVKSNFTLTLGDKDTGSDGTYAKNGSQVVVTGDPLFTATTADRGDILVAGSLLCYSSLISGFGTVNIGNGGSATSELIQSDFYDNTEVDLNSSSLTLLNCKFHFPGTAKASIGKVYNVSSVNGMWVYQVTDGFEFRLDKDIFNYIAKDTTYDMVILEGKTVSFIDGDFSATKIKRVAS